MARTFAYVRVSTAGQTTENQIQKIEAAGFAVIPRHFMSETMSGSSATEQRHGFIPLMDKLEQDDVLIVTKLDRLGRDGCRHHDGPPGEDGCARALPRLGRRQPDQPGRKMTMGVINAVAQFERELQIERTQSHPNRPTALRP